MCPFHKVDLLKLFQVHVRVDEFVLGRGAVLVELGLPVREGHGRQGAGDGSPFRDAQTASQLVSTRKTQMAGKILPRLGQSCQTAKDDNAKNARSATNKPPANTLSIGFRERRRLGRRRSLRLCSIHNVAAERHGRRLDLGGGTSPRGSLQKLEDPGRRRRGSSGQRLRSQQAGSAGH